MAAHVRKHDVDDFDDDDVEIDSFNLENTTWKRLLEQKHKVNLYKAELTRWQDDRRYVCSVGVPGLAGQNGDSQNGVT